jgi:hypothetical protein
MALCLFIVVGLCLWSTESGRGALKRGGTLTVVHGVDVSYLDV